MKKFFLFFLGVGSLVVLFPLGVNAATCTGEITKISGACVPSADACVLPNRVDGLAGCPTATPVCCTFATPVPGAGTCAGGSGTCKASCLATENSGTDALCTGATPSCCTPTPPSGGGAGGGTFAFQNPLAFNTVEAVFGALLTGLQGIIVTLALVFIVVGAVLYVTSAGNEKRIETAKNAIFAAMIGLALGIAAPSFLKEISLILGWGEVPAEVSASASIATILLNVLNFLLGILGVLAIIMMVIGGFMYLTSAGDESRIETGKKIVIWSIVGVIVALASLMLVGQVATFF